MSFCRICLLLMSFNRTFMELKFGSDLYKAGSGNGFNRTFMELKWAKMALNDVNTQMFQSYLYGIEITTTATKAAATIVSIVPLWN